MHEYVNRLDALQQEQIQKYINNNRTLCLTPFEVACYPQTQHSSIRRRERERERDKQNITIALRAAVVWFNEN